MASNADEKVFGLIQDCRVKAQWQALAAQYGKQRADRMVAQSTKLPTYIVSRARYYW